MTRGMGAAAALVGLPLLAENLWRFARVGRGTPSPLMPTESLVTSGAYRFVRNPMYVGAVLVVLGQAVMFASLAALFYGGALACAFHLTVLLYEEPTLRKRHGMAYARYRERVPRWVPRMTPWAPPKSPRG
jgi:protein-S-isoprenylcysteine O-methyltransferase Ste14